MVKKKSRLISVWVYIGIFCFLVLGFSSVFFYCHSESGKKRTYSYTAETLNAPQDGVYVKWAVSKQWDDDTLHPAIPCGAQYDGVLSNQSRFMFQNWSVRLTLSQKATIDSAWNGTFTCKDNVVLFVAQGEEQIAVEAGTEQTFGAVMYSTRLMDLKGYTLTGYRLVNPTDVLPFWLLIILSVLWIIFVISHCVFRARMKQYQQRRKLDAEIIQQSMNTFTGFIDAKDAYTKGHSARVAAYSAEIARRMKWESSRVEQLYYITLMHDCGKIGIPDAVLKKPGKLTDEEYRLIQSHTTLGLEILRNFTAIPGIRDGAHYHHERYDGRGYPEGLKGNDIPLCARIIGVADAFDAMSTDRCYRMRLDKETILRELKDNAGKQFDPTIVPYMVDMINDGFVESVRTRHPSFRLTTDKQPVVAD